jgi:hypothetical protein
MILIFLAKILTVRIISPSHLLRQRSTLIEIVAMILIKTRMVQHVKNQEMK